MHLDYAVVLDNEGKPFWTLDAQDQTHVKIYWNKKHITSIKLDELDRYQAYLSQGRDLFEACHHCTTPHELDKLKDMITYMRFGSLVNPTIGYTQKPHEGYTLYETPQRVIGVMDHERFHLEVMTHPYDSIIKDGYVLFTASINHREPMFFLYEPTGSSADAFMGISLALSEAIFAKDNVMDAASGMIGDLMDKASKVWDTDVEEEKWWEEYDPQDHPDYE